MEMYLKEMAIKNIGPIDKLVVRFPFDENKNPIPIVFVGENGTGKTILQSQIVDSLYELANKLFSNVLPAERMMGYKYYKMSGGSNLQTGKDYGFSIISFIDNQGNKLEFYEKIGNVSKESFTELLPDFSIAPDNNKDNQKKVSNIEDGTKKESLQKEFLTEPHFYQPAYRYEEPFWKNEPFLDDSRLQDKRHFSGKLEKEIEIITAAKNNKIYLLDLVLDFSINNNAPDGKKWSQINYILKEIKQRQNIRFGIGPRGGYRVSIVEENQDGTIKLLLPSIDNLSLGESILLNLFINIIRHSDNPPKDFVEIRGVVIIDEIDVHLHENLRSNVLPTLIKLFPKIQFIITTHSPLFLLGMKNVFGEDGFEIRNMPKGEAITTERFSEFGKAYEAFKNTEKFENDLEQKVENSAKPILFVEGENDIKYIKKSAELLGKMDLLDKVKMVEAGGCGNLDQIWKHYSTKLSDILPVKILLLYDCDTKKNEEEKGNLFKKIIPFISINPIKAGIENLFPDLTIKRAQQYNNSFIDHTPSFNKTVRGQTVNQSEKYEVNKSEKSNLCAWLCGNNDRTDFEGFSVLFDILEEILFK